MKKLKLFSLVMVAIASCLLLSACGSNISLKINFDSNGGTYCKPIEYVVGKSFNMPDDPTKENRIFGGWYEDNGTWEKSFTVNSVLNYPLSKNVEITVYAKWIEKCKLVFDSKGGSDCSPLYLETADATLPTPTYDGYKFDGWYLDDNTLQNKYYIGKDVASDNHEIKLYAKWTKILKKTIYYSSTLGDLDKEFDVIEDGQELSLYVPYEVGYDFAGWFYDEDFEYPAPNTFNCSMINTYNNTITLYAKFTSREIKQLSIIGELKTHYQYGEEFDPNGAKLKIEYVDKNYDDDIVDITKEMVSGFYTTDNKGDSFNNTDTGVCGTAYIHYRPNTLSTTSVDFTYYVDSDIESFSVVDSNELIFTHGKDTNFRDRNINITWTDKTGNTGTTKLTEFNNYTMNYYIQKRKETTGSFIIDVVGYDFIIISPGYYHYRNNCLDVSNYGTFTAKLRYHFKTIEVEYTVLPSEDVVNGKYDDNLYLNETHSILGIKSSWGYYYGSCLYLYDSNLEQYIEWKDFDESLIVKDIDTTTSGSKKAVALYNGKEIEIDYYVIDPNEIKSAKFVYDVNQNETYDNYSGYRVEFTLNDGHTFKDYVFVRDLVGFSNENLGEYTCTTTFYSKEIEISYTVVSE